MFIWVCLGKLIKLEVVNGGNLIFRLISMFLNGVGEFLDGDGFDRKKIKILECVRLVIYIIYYCFNLIKFLYYFILYSNKDLVILFIYVIFCLLICVKNVLIVFIFYFDYKYYFLIYSEELIINKIVFEILV